MVSAWYMDTSGSKDQREDHKYEPNREVKLDELYKKTGVEYFSIALQQNEQGEYEENPELSKIRKDRGYSYQDEVDIRPGHIENYEQKLKIFFEEHFHADEEIRYCLDGSGYFDVRDGEENWIRIQMVPGDMIILPAGIYHRFTLDTKNYIKAKRFFVGEPVWTPHNRSVDGEDSHPARVSYRDHFLGQCVKG